MPAPETASLPPFFILSKGMTVRFTALDPTDGSLVAGVGISNMSIAVLQDDTDFTPPDATAQPVTLLPGPETV